MTYSTKRALQALLLCLAVVLAAGAASAADEFQDMPVIAEAVNAALEYQKTGASVPWSSAETGNKGTITVLRTFFQGGAPCREYRRTVEQNGVVKDSVTGVGCRANNGVWNLQEGNSPAPGAQTAGAQTAGSQAGASQAALNPVTPPPVSRQRVRAGQTYYINVWAYRTPLGEGRGDLFVLQDVYSQELLESYPREGALHVDLLDGGKLRLGANAQVRLDEFVYDPASGTGKVTASIGRGVCRFITGKVKGDNFQVRSPTALIGARGTDFVVGVSASGTAIHVISGSVEVTPLGGAPPQLVSAGQVLGVGPGGTSTTTAVSRPYDPGIEEVSATPNFRRRSSMPGFGSRRNSPSGGNSGPSGGYSHGHSD